MSNNNRRRSSGGGSTNLRGSGRHPRNRPPADFLADESDAMPDHSLRRIVNERCHQANAEVAAELLAGSLLGGGDEEEEGDDWKKNSNQVRNSTMSANTVQHANVKKLASARPQQRQLTDEEIKRNEKERQFGRSNTTGNAKPSPGPPVGRTQTTGGGQHPSQRQLMNEGAPPKQQQQLTDEQIKQREKFRLSNTVGGGGGGQNASQRQFSGGGVQSASQRQLSGDGTPPSAPPQRPLTDEEIKNREKERAGGPRATSLGRTQTTGDDQPLRRPGSLVSPPPPATTTMGRTVTQGDAPIRQAPHSNTNRGGDLEADADPDQQAKMDELSMRNMLARRSMAANQEIAAAERNILLTAQATGSTRRANEQNNMAAANIVLEEKRQSLNNEKSGEGSEILETSPPVREQSTAMVTATGAAATQYSNDGTPAKSRGALPAGSNRPGAYSNIPGMGYGRVASARYDGLGLAQDSPSSRSISVSDRLVTADNPAPALEQPPALESGDDDEEDNDEEAPPYDEPDFDAPCEVAPANDNDNNNDDDDDDANSKEELENTVQKYKTFLMIAGVVLVLVIIVAIVIPVVMGSSGDSDQPEATPAPTDVEVDPSIIPNVPDSTWVKLFDKSSPQYKAYSWIVQDPVFDMYEDWQITQRYSLATFYYAMNGPKWENSWQWLNYSLNECSWMEGYNICHDDLRIKLLNITKQRGFKGKMPIEVTLLTRLEGIDFSDNVLGGDLTSLFDNDFNHHALQVFWCSDCRLGGTIPTEFFQMTALRGVVLNNNDLTGELPPEIGQLQDLIVLELNDNKFTGAIPTTIGNLQQLIGLRALGNKFSSLQSEIGKLSALKVLYLNDNHLDQSIPSELGALTELQYLELSKNSLYGKIPSELGWLANLERMLLNVNNLSGSIPVEFGSLSKINWLWINDNDLVGSIPASVGNMTLLTKFDLYRNELTSEIPSELGLLIALTELKLFDNKLSGSIPSEIANLVQLTAFDVSANPLIVEELPEEFCPSPPAKIKTEWCEGAACCA